MKTPGACASCKNIRSYKIIDDKLCLIPYDGSKHARCVLQPHVHIIIADSPNYNLPLNECWDDEV